LLVIWIGVVAILLAVAALAVVVISQAAISR
jgi:hypothetical protein